MEGMRMAGQGGLAREGDGWRHSAFTAFAFLHFVFQTRWQVEKKDRNRNAILLSPFRGQLPLLATTTATEIITPFPLPQ